MPRGRKKRHDPVDAPIDGDYSMDVILNRDPGKTYAWLAPEDVPKFKARGYTKVARSEDPDAPRPAFDAGSPGDAGYSQGQLEAYEIPLERHDRIVAHEQRIQDNNMAAIEREAGRTGGEFSRRVTV